jgi:hypothetical protein
LDVVQGLGDKSKYISITKQVLKLKQDKEESILNLDNSFQKSSFKKETSSWVPVAHTCNPSYSGGRDQEDCSLKPAPANSSTRPYLEKLFTKIGSGWRHWVQAPVSQKKKKLLG